jgi:hypothetical protein
VGDYFQHIVDVQVGDGAAAGLAAGLVAWLVETGVIEAELTDCALGDLGHRPGPGCRAAVTDAVDDDPEPAVQVNSRTELAPDIVVVHEDQAEGMKFTTPPLLVVEVRSPGTALIDLSRKKAVYERFGVASYWIVDPEPARPELTVFELRDGHYIPEAKTTQTITLDRPFRVTITLTDLTRGLRR